MKRQIIIAGTLIAGLLLTTGCYKEGGIFGIRGSGPIEEEERVVGAFDKVDVGIAGRIYITQSNDEFVRIEAQENIIDNIETYVVGSKLKIRFRRNVTWHDGIRIYISNPTYEGLSVSGSSDLSNETDIHTGSLELNISGSGSIELDDVRIDNDLNQQISGSGQVILSNLRVGEDIDSQISGSGKLTMSGPSTVDYHHVVISGSGSVHSEDIWVDWLDVHISGSGNCRASVISKLDATISGSGSVFYYGNPQVSTHISGSGNIKHLP